MNSQETALEEVRERLIKLERQNRRLKQTGAAALIVAASLFPMGQASRTKTVEANEFVLRDSGGNVRARLSVDDKTLGASLVLSEKNGSDDLVLSSNARIGGGMVALKKSEETLLLLPSSVGFYHSGDEKTPDVVKAQFSSDALFVTDDQGFVARIGAIDLTKPSTGETRKRSAASIVLVDKEKHVLWEAP
jgi:hypothetical protein